MGGTASLRFYRWNLALSVRNIGYLYRWLFVNLLFHEPSIPEFIDLSFFYLITGDLSFNIILARSSPDKPGLFITCAVALQYIALRAMDVPG